MDTIKKVLIAYLLLASAGLLAQIPTQDRVLMGAMSIPQYSLIQQIPLPQFSNQKFCSLVQLAPNVLTWAYVPTAAERVGNFSNFPTPLTDPISNTPFPNNMIPLSRIPSTFAWRLPVFGPLAGEVCVPATSIVPEFTSADYVTGLNAALDVLSASPSTINFNYRLGDPVPAPQTFTVVAAKTQLVYRVAPQSATLLADWLVFSPTLSNNPAAVLQVGVLPAELAVGSYTATLSLVAIGAIATPQPITINVQVTSPPSWLVVLPRALNFFYNLTDPATIPPPQQIGVLSLGSATGFSTRVMYVTPPNTPWFSISPTSGTAAAEITVTLDANLVTKVGRGSFVGYVDVFGSSILPHTTGNPPMVPPNSPQRVVITADVSPNPDFIVNPQGFQFMYTPGGPLPSQPILLTPVQAPLDNTANLMFNVAITNMDARDPLWLSAAPGSFSLGKLVPLTASLLPAVQCITPGAAHQATIAFNAARLTLDDQDVNTAGTVAVSVQVPATMGAAPDLTIAKSHAGTFTQGQTGAQYSITVGNSGACDVVAGNTVTVSDNLAAGLTATGIAGSGWTCTQPSGTCTRSDALASGSSYPLLTLTVNVAPNAPSSVTNQATVSGGGETNTSNDIANDPTTVLAGQTSNPNAPTILPGGVVPIFSSTTTIEPGSWSSIYGTNFAVGTSLWDGTFPKALGGVSVQVNGKPAYLWLVSPGQINFQAPDDTQRGPVMVSVTNSAGTATSTATLADFGPTFSMLDATNPAGVIPVSSGGAYGNGTYDLVGPSGHFSFNTRPVKKGETVELFGTGFGPASPAVPAGQPFSGAAQTTKQVTVVLGGVSMSLPAYVVGAGLYQINVTIPQNVGGGSQSLIATTPDGQHTPSNVQLAIQ